MIQIDELLGVKKDNLKNQFIELLFKEELISEPVYYKALEMIKEESRIGNIE